MNIREGVIKFTQFVLAADADHGDLQVLIQALDELPLLVYACEFDFDAACYPSPPAINYQEIRSVIERKFPEHHSVRSFGSFQLGLLARCPALP